MKKEMNDIDALIKESLSKEDAKFYDDLEEQNILGKIGQIYKGKLGWLAIIMIIYSLLFFGFMIYCTIEFFNTDVVQKQLLWASGFFISLSIVCMIKIYIWIQMNKNDVLRELKRLELQLSVLSNKG